MDNNTTDKFVELNNVGYTALIFFIVSNVLLISTTLFTSFVTNSNYQKTKNIILLTYHLLFFVILVAVSFSVGNTKCGLSSSFDAMKSITSALTSYIFVFFAGSSFLYFFPGWVRGFSNTFGLSALYLSNFKEFIQNKIFRNEPNANSSNLHQKIYNDPLPLFNELEPDFVHDEKSSYFQWDSYERLNNKVEKQGGVDFYRYKVSQEPRDVAKNEHIFQLAKKIAKKDFIGYVIWYTALGCISILFTVIQTLDTKCVRDPTQSTEFREYTAKKFDEV